MAPNRLVPGDCPAPPLTLAQAIALRVRLAVLWGMAILVLTPRLMRTPAGQDNLANDATRCDARAAAAEAAGLADADVGVAGETAAGLRARARAQRGRAAVLTAAVNARLIAPQQIFLSKDEEDEWIMLTDAGGGGLNPGVKVRELCDAHV